MFPGFPNSRFYRVFWWFPGGETVGNQIDWLLMCGTASRARTLRNVWRSNYTKINSPIISCWKKHAFIGFKRAPRAVFVSTRYFGTGARYNRLVCAATCLFSCLHSVHVCCVLVLTRQPAAMSTMQRVYHYWVVDDPVPQPCVCKYYVSRITRDDLIGIVAAAQSL